MSENVEKKTAGHSLKNGTYKDGNLSDSDIMNIFDDIFSSKSKNASSYKFGFLKSILDNLFNFTKNGEQYIISYDILFEKFAEIYWNLVLDYEISQMPKTKGKSGTFLESILREAVQKFNIPEKIVFEAIDEDASKWIVKEVKKKCKINVVGALYRDSKDYFYSFSNREEWLELNPAFFNFLIKYRGIIEKVNYFEWARFLEKINDEKTTYKLLNKLDESTKRKNLSVYRDILYWEFEQQKCFYCGKPLRNTDRIHVDHFVPWSKVKDDQLWNFVLACESCNLNKHDKMPSNEYFNVIVERNEEMMQLESIKAKMKGYQREQFAAMYKSMVKYGREDTWEPNR